MCGAFFFWSCAIAPLNKRRLPLGDKEKLLHFWCSGLPSGGIPGLGRRLVARFKAVESYGGGALLPEAHTCFYDLTIPATTDRGKMRDDFIAQAVAHWNVFGNA